jgi:hypothetical protein
MKGSTMRTTTLSFRKPHLIVAFVWLGIALLPQVSLAQDTTVTVPDLTGLSVPNAAAVLNSSGLALGAESGERWSEEAGLPPNTIRAQAIAPGQTVNFGTAVDVTVLRSPNVLLLYDDTSFTLINQTGVVLDLNGLSFNALEGTPPSSFAAARWASGLSEGGRCVQVWSIGRTGPARPPECTAVQRWLTTNKPAEHFWNGSNGAARFNVVQNGIERIVCETAPPGSGQKRCEFYSPSDTSTGDVTKYVYFAYTSDRLIVLNQSASQWMPLSQMVVYNYNPNLQIPGASLTVGDPSLFGNPTIVARIERLAPGQCLFFTNSSPDATTPPQPCDVIARLDVNPGLIFWGADFELASAGSDRRHKCPAAVEGRLTICVMPR